MKDKNFGMLHAAFLNFQIKTMFSIAYLISCIPRRQYNFNHPTFQVRTILMPSSRMYDVTLILPSHANNIFSYNMSPSTES